MLRWIAQIFGVLLVVLSLLDLFLTVLYARGGRGILSARLATCNWYVFKHLALWMPRSRDKVLTFAGPVLLTLAACMWVGGLLFGFALIVWPALGGDVRASQGETSRSFWTAVYFSGYWMTTVGNGDLVPQTAFYRVLMAVDSIVGISTITLMLTYFMQIYTALQRKTALALIVHHATARTGDAAELLAGMGAAGSFDDARSRLSALADELTTVYEGHHFYGSLLYFRFEDPFYALPRMILVLLDATSLLRTALDPERYASLVRSGSLTELWEAGSHMLDQLSRVFIPPKGEPARGEVAEPSAIALWRARYFDAVSQLQASGVATVPDPNAGADRYLALRTQWDGSVIALSQYLLYSPSDIDPAGNRTISRPASL